MPEFHVGDRVKWQGEDGPHPGTVVFVNGNELEVEPDERDAFERLHEMPVPISVSDVISLV